MDLQTSLFLLMAIFTAGQCLSCQRCYSESESSSCDQLNCPSEMTSCFATSSYLGSSVSLTKNCALPNAYSNGSVNLGQIRLSTYSCNKDMCNTENSPDPNNVTPNGHTCYYCDGKDCSKIVGCSGKEDFCATWTGDTPMKGCITASLCTSDSLIFTTGKFDCCEGDLCNADPTTTQSTTLTTIPTTITTTTPTTGPTTAPSTTKSVPHCHSGAQSVVQSLLFLCASLLSFTLIN